MHRTNLLKRLGVTVILLLMYLIFFPSSVADTFAQATAAADSRPAAPTAAADPAAAVADPAVLDAPADERADHLTCSIRHR